MDKDKSEEQKLNSIFILCPYRLECDIDWSMI